MAFSRSDLPFVNLVSRLSYCNPFSAERLALERAALGEDFKELEQQWNVYVGSTGELTNIVTICERVEQVLTSVQHAPLSPTDELLFDDLVVFVLYHRYRSRLSAIVEQGSSAGVATLYRAFASDVETMYAGRASRSTAQAPAYLFALAFQIARAFFYIYRFIIGASQPMITLRARIWESIFSADLRRYRRSLAGTLHELPTLITGPSGTGKELVARAIGLSQFIPFNPQASRFAEDFQLRFHALNLSAFSPTIIESELFGHKRGSFTGAVSDRTGWLAAAGRYGTVFLDEIGELDLSIQVKLLRVLESRTFQRLGDTRAIPFEGKLITATNRSLPAELERGKFRRDLFFRLVGDQIETPSLKTRIESSPEELSLLVQHLALRLLPSEESQSFAQDAVSWIEKHIPLTYEWPGNVRELEQCLRNLLMHGRYTPLTTRAEAQLLPPFLDDAHRGSLTVEQLIDRYTTHVYQQTNNYEETGRRLGLDRRTVKRRVQRDS